MKFQILSLQCIEPKKLGFQVGRKHIPEKIIIPTRHSDIAPQNTYTDKPI